MAPSSPPRGSRAAHSATSQRTSASASVGQRKAALSCPRKGPPHDDRSGQGAASGGRRADATLWPPALRLAALVADGPDPRLPLGGVRLSRSPTAVAQSLRQDGRLHDRALPTARYGAGLFHGPAKYI